MTPAPAATEPTATITSALHRLRRSYRRYGWTIWHGDATGQYWAAHTGRMVLLSGDSDTELAAAIDRFRPALPRGTGTARHWPARHLPTRPRPRAT